MMNKLKRKELWIANPQGHLAESLETYAVLNPSNGQHLADVPYSGYPQALDAIDLAYTAMQSWKKETAKTRAQIIKKWFDVVLANSEDLSIILSTEQGKPLAESRAEVAYAASFIEWFAEEAKRAYGDVIPSHKKDAKIIVTKEPIGVVAAITPWNLPYAMVTRKLAPALAAGCAVVLKPSEETPLTAHALLALAAEAGVPPGVLQCVSGNAKKIGEAFLESEKIRKISFTGSTRVGKYLAEQAGKSIKKVSLELGGNAPFIVFDDANIDQAVAGAVASKFRNAGQTCVSVNRFYIHDKVHDVFVQKFTDAVKQFKQGDAFTEGVTQGPLINASALAKVQTHVDDAINQGGQIIIGGTRSKLGGLFFEPTVITNANHKMMMAHDEIFGPVAAIYRFHTDEEVLLHANDSPYGLSAYFYSNNLERVWRIATALEVGMVGVNEGMISTEVAPFGGIKESGLGREGSKYGLADYMETKYILMGGLSAA